ncbi:MULTISPECIES: hypothetical protein [Calothrix]|uniref:Uncharacterized protein n=2 Tax=Calothrix TaxID=1186 RepID=A0ABR8AHM3_9CYAN|nr:MULTISPECIES: hypothetical protein [Calothrix]MBD2199535.1 hypothetical protein [Calothrix parietina FACHB-288]MBD2228312.1 hypothetical protein [Calothrix anomala FACHB-343]
MRYILILAMSFCILLSGCEFFIPHTSDAISQTKQLQELQKQTKQIQLQTEALERLSDSAAKLANPQN